MAGPFTTDFSADFGNGAFLARGRAMPRGRGGVQFSVGSNPISVSARGYARSSGNTSFSGTSPFSTEFSGEFGVGAVVGGATSPYSVDYAADFGAGSTDTIFVSLGAWGRAADRSISDGAAIPTLGLRGRGFPSGVATQVPITTGTSTGPWSADYSADFGPVASTIGPWSADYSADFGPVAVLGGAVNVSARGAVAPRGMALRPTAVAARGSARPKASSGAAAIAQGGFSPWSVDYSSAFGGAAIVVSVSLQARGIAIPRGRASRSFGLVTARGFAEGRGRVTVTAATLRIPVAARGKAMARGTALDSIQAQQVPVFGAPPPLTIWQRLSTATPSSSMNEKPRLLRNSFGDGYGQSIPDGMTGVVRTMTLTWENIDRTEADQIIQFLHNSIGRPISFVAPREQSPRNWLAMDWKRSSPEPDADNITVTFEDRPYVEMVLGLL